MVSPLSAVPAAPAVGAQEFSFDVEKVFAPLRGTGWRFRLFALALSAVALWGVFAYVWQLRHGLASTGLTRPAYWGVYMVNFVFFTGISMAGTVISAILRIAHAEWRRPVTRCAEVITVTALVFGGLSVVLDMGRPDRVLNVFLWGRIQSPIFWDVMCISAYLTASLVYLYLPLIPDLAILRDRKIGVVWLYRLLAVGYTGTERQKARLERVLSVVAILIIPIAISVHTVVSYIFATTLQPGWHSTIFGPYFVVGAIFSGVGALLVTMAIIRKAFKLESILQDIHFNNLGLIFLVMAGLMIYFTFNIYFVEFTGNEPEVLAPVMDKIHGPYSVPFWGMVGLGFLLPALILSFPKGRKVPGLVLSGLLVVAAMWIERFVIIAPTLNHPRLPWAHGLYHPTWVEGSVTAGCLAAFVLLYALFTRFFPIVSIWEVQEGIEHSIPEVSERLATYLPADGRR